MKDKKWKSNIPDVVYSSEERAIFQKNLQERLRGESLDLIVTEKENKHMRTILIVEKMKLFVQVKFFTSEGKDEVEVGMKKKSCLKKMLSGKNLN